MILLLATVLAATPCLLPTVGGDDPDLRSLYEAGITYEAFHSQAERRKAMWDRNTGWAEVPDPLLARARQAVARANGPLHVLAVAVDGCSDSANTIPYLAALVNAVEGLEMRIIDSRVGRDIMVLHRTPDGRPATPTVLVLNETFDEVGAFIERPLPLQEWALAADSTLSGSDFLEAKFAWYDADRGASTMEEVVAILEAAGRPGMLDGAFMDDYDATHTVTATSFSQGERTIYHITEWNLDDQYLLARNDMRNSYAPGAWSRIDWVQLDDMAPWTWAFCMSAYDAATAEEARMAPEADRSAPRTGCFGSPFTRMKRP